MFWFTDDPAGPHWLGAGRFTVLTSSSHPAAFTHLHVDVSSRGLAVQSPSSRSGSESPPSFGIAPSGAPSPRLWDSHFCLRHQTFGSQFCANDRMLCSNGRTLAPTPWSVCSFHTRTPFLGRGHRGKQQPECKDPGREGALPRAQAQGREGCEAGWGLS